MDKEKKDDEEVSFHSDERRMKGRIREKIMLRLDEKLEGRGNVVMTRLNDDDLKQIDALVEIDVFKSRSEAAAFFIKEGIRARGDLFQRVMPTVDRIRELKEEAKQSLGNIEM
jgi:Arc/MetJ-type ribon-helix-helix transcriptional regulator